MSLTTTGAASKVRVKEGDDLIPKTSFAPIAAPEKLNAFRHNTQYLQEHMRLVYEDIVRIFIASKVPVFLWGPMGSGKTRGVEALANEQDEAGNHYQVITVQPSTEDPSTFHGLMTVTLDPRSGSKIMERSIPQIAEKVWNGFQQDKLTIMFLDEMTTCTPAHQNAMLGLLTHGKYGERDISRYVTFVLAANPPGTVSTVTPLSEAVINRGGHIPWYSDADHWYGKWTGGFGDPTRIPRERTKEFIKLLLAADPDVAFRDDPDNHEDKEDSWDIDNLCPYEQMHFSERSVTEFAKVYEIIQDSFAPLPFDVKSLYLQECAKAMLGKRWEKHVGLIEKAIESTPSIKPTMDILSLHKIDYEFSLEEIKEIVGENLHFLAGRKMTVEQETQLGKIFLRDTYEDGGFSHKRYLGFWVWLCTMTSARARAAVMPTVIEIFTKCRREFKDDIPESHIVPGFVPSEIKQEMKELLHRAREMKQ